MNTNFLNNKPAIRILIYTDDPNGITLGLAPDNDLSLMRTLLLAHAPIFATVEVDLIARDSDQATKLSLDLLHRYDQVWFFGIHHVGSQVSVLTTEEIDVLEAWMSIAPEKHLFGGGVLMTGDHAEAPPQNVQITFDNSCPDTTGNAEFLGLGRALGRCVPRARFMRKWEGEPTARKGDSFNTQTPVPGIDIDSLRLQFDPRPQELILRRFDSRGRYTPNGTPHPLFFFRDGQCITLFPDHAHEGAVVVPTEFEKDEWPTGKYVRPTPDVVAYGTDKRNCKLLNILAAYNGDSADVGRVVADSTWHHYLNINLNGFPAETGAAADQIGQYYANLAVWLTPRRKRQEMAHLMFWTLVNDPAIRQELGSDLIDLGRAAYSVLIRAGSPLCEIHELIHAAIPDELCKKFANFFIPEHGFALNPFPSKELILGCVLKTYFDQITRLKSAGTEAQQSDLVGITPAAVMRAFEEQLKQITEVLDNARQILNKA